MLHNSHRCKFTNGDPLKLNCWRNAGSDTKNTSTLRALFLISTLVSFSLRFFSIKKNSIERRVMPLPSLHSSREHFIGIAYGLEWYSGSSFKAMSIQNSHLKLFTPFYECIPLTLNYRHFYRIHSFIALFVVRHACAATKKFSGI